ncbi:2-C-methyl-D-erythritol 2,4-cyclodiphosphate synthase [Puteibacter caeruleilacunae]|nr:2-C-methyl-D-erythritol 2,4-cyclodiphosphate synthase [Puteibacter caeruleilacunae]
MQKIRVGIGYDVHSLAEGESLWLGGIQIPHTKGTVAHSDGDVLIHAICDALLGAAGLRDIGKHFPDTDDEFKGIDSKVLLKRTIQLLSEKGYTVGNVDCTLCAQRPKLAPYIDQMEVILAKLMKVDVDDVCVKATTTERLGFVGREEGMAAHAVALIVKE